MNLDNDKRLVGLTVLIDPYIHLKAKLSREEFLERTKFVDFIRTGYNSSYISFYITSLYEYDNLIKFHNLVNKGVFDFNGYMVFAIAMQPKLYNWFKTSSITTIQKQIVCWLAGTYYFQPDKRNIKKQQLYKPLFEEILEVIAKYFNDFKIPCDNGEECKKKYLQVCREFYKTEPPEFLQSPFDYENLKDWGVNDCCNFEFIEAYFTKNDWKNIIVGNSKDNMHRVESREELWIKWRHFYSTFDQRKKLVYSFYFDPKDERGKEDKKKREIIPQDVRNKVWQRDNGMCITCGSQEKLEFDHIIPVSKGGSSTYRNVQLLCEPCNRKKTDNI